MVQIAVLNRVDNYIVSFPEEMLLLRAPLLTVLLFLHLLLLHFSQCHIVESVIHTNHMKHISLLFFHSLTYLVFLSTTLLLLSIQPVWQL